MTTITPIIAAWALGFIGGEPLMQLSNTVRYQPDVAWYRTERHDLEHAPRDIHTITATNTMGALRAAIVTLKGEQMGRGSFGALLRNINTTAVDGWGRQVHELASSEVHDLLLGIVHMSDLPTTKAMAAWAAGYVTIETRYRLRNMNHRAPMQLVGTTWAEGVPRGTADPVNVYGALYLAGLEFDVTRDLLTRASNAAYLVAQQGAAYDIGREAADLLMQVVRGRGVR